MRLLESNLQVLTRELSLYLEIQVPAGLFGSGVGLSLVLGFSAAFACYYLSSIAKVSGAKREGRDRRTPADTPTEKVSYYGLKQLMLQHIFCTASPPSLPRHSLFYTINFWTVCCAQKYDSSCHTSSPNYVNSSYSSLMGDVKFVRLCKPSSLHFGMSLRLIQMLMPVFFPCGSLQTPRTYCAANTEDLEAVIHHIHNMHASAPFMAAGVSMGGMLLLNYLGQTGRETPLMAAAIFSAGWNVFESAESLEKPLNWLLFNYYLTTCLQSSVSRHRQMLEKLFDMNLVMKAKTIREFDKQFTSVMFGYNIIDDYYVDASPCCKLKSIEIPVLCLNSMDDVFSPSHAIPMETFKQNPNVALVLTSCGGHIGFLEGIWPRKCTYMDRVFKQFVQAVFEHGNQIYSM
uniref:Phospholipase ABHD3 n=1 Tax=Pelusios castaneus TaxID=367368 RepID=A0A8C8SHM2_9SAUR